MGNWARLLKNIVQWGEGHFQETLKAMWRKHKSFALLAIRIRILTASATVYSDSACLAVEFFLLQFVWLTYSNTIFVYSH